MPNCLWKLIFTYLDIQTLFLSISRTSKFFNTFISKDYQFINSITLDFNTLIIFNKSITSSRSQLNFFFKANEKIKKYAIYLKQKNTNDKKIFLHEIFNSLSYAKELKIISESHEIINSHFEGCSICNLKNSKIRITMAKANLKSLTTFINTSNFNKKNNLSQTTVPILRSLKKNSLSFDSFSDNNSNVDIFFQTVNSSDITEISIRPITIADPDTYNLLNADNFSLKFFKLKLPAHIKFTAKACY